MLLEVMDAVDDPQVFSPPFRRQVIVAMLASAGLVGDRPVCRPVPSAEAAGVVLDWPAALLRTLERDAGRRIGNRGDERHRAICAFLRGETLDGAAARAVVAVAGPLRTSGGGRFASNGDAVSVRTAAFALGDGTGEIAKARRSGVLRTRLMINGGELVPGLDGREIESLRTSLLKRSSTFVTARRLGIPAYAVQDLVTLGALTHDPHPYLATRRPWPFLTEDEVAALAERLAPHAVDEAPDGARLLRSLFRTMPVGPRPWAHAIRAHLDGSSPLACLPGPEPIGRRLLASPGQAVALAAGALRLDANGTAAADRVVSTEDAVEMLGLTVKESRRTRQALLASSPDGLLRIAMVVALGRRPA